VVAMGMLHAIGCSPPPGGGPADVGTGSDAAESGPDPSDASVDGEGPASSDGWELSRGGFVVHIAGTGAISDVRDADGRSWDRGLGGDNLIRVGVAAGALVTCDAPRNITRSAGEVSFDYDLRPEAPVLVRSTITLVDAAGGVAIKRSVQVTPAAPPLQALVKVSVGDNLGVPGTDATVFVPHRDGYGEQAPLATTRRLHFALAGTTLDAEGADQLAIPMVSETDAQDHRLTRVADVFFSSSFAIGAMPSAESRITWAYLGDQVPMLGPESRDLFHVLHRGPAEAAMDAFYATAVSDVPPGPAWLHDITWQHYDYMSNGGLGWFADIDALTAALPEADRKNILLTIHGWFDVYGRYAFDPATRRLTESWTSFPNAPNVQDTFPGTQATPMTKAEVHRRIAYAKSRGFRVGLYFADGTASGEDVDGLWRADRALWRGGWQGPDTTSQMWTMNPAHPDVFAYFADYTDALLAEFGAEIDALVWDETFLVHVGTVGPAAMPSYADRAMMRLVRDLTLRVTAENPELALLTSDNVGFECITGEQNAPYAIVAHGTYQDSHSNPGVWRHGLFPNFRNTLWSCNWLPQTHFAWTELGVEQFNTPVATSNGWGDKLGIADLDQTNKDKLFALFAKRKAAGPQVLKWLSTRLPVLAPCEIK
jgi:hypothetical protein